MTNRKKTRRQARERALQFLFGLDFAQYELDEAALELFWNEFEVNEDLTCDSGEDVLEVSWLLHPSAPDARQYAERLVRGICENRQAIDEEITAALQNWSADRVGRIEWNIVRIALYEMRYMKNVPPAVAINEAIEIAKLYGHDDVPRFVNGILDRLRQEPDGHQPDDE